MPTSVPTSNSQQAFTSRSLSQYPEMDSRPSRTSRSTWEEDGSPITPALPEARSNSMAKEPILESTGPVDIPDMDVPPPYSAAAPVTQPSAFPVTSRSIESSQVLDDGALSRAAARNAMATQPSTRRKSIHRHRSRKKSIHFAKSLRPGIKVDTSYSRHRAGAPQQIFPHGRPSHNRSVSKGGAFISLADLKPPESPGNVASTAKKSWFPKGLGLGRGVESSSASQDQYPRDNSSVATTSVRFKAKTLRRKARESQTTPIQHMGLSPEYERPSPLDQLLLRDISPSDRPITIGISVPSDVADAHSISPQSAQPRSNGDLETPTIIVTPAQSASEWSRNPNHIPRPASSIYSRNTAYFNGTSARSSEVPPVPLLPQALAASNPFADEIDHGTHGSHGSHGRDSIATAFEEDDTPKDRRRVMSTDTLFEDDDETPLTSVSRNGRLSPYALALQTTIEGDRRSNGWWNVITTPFEASRPTSQFSKHIKPGDPTRSSVPELPPIDFVSFAQQRNLSPVSPNNAYSGWSPDSTEFDDNSPYQISPAQRQANSRLTKHATTTKAPFPSLAEVVHENVDEHSLPNHWPDFDGASPRHRSVDRDELFENSTRKSRASPSSTNIKEIPKGFGTMPQRNVLDSDNAFGLHIPQSQQLEPTRPHESHQSPSDIDHKEEEVISPLSREAAFSPIDVGVASVGTVFNARTVNNNTIQNGPVALTSETRQAAATPAPLSYSYSSRSSSHETETRHPAQDLHPPPQVYLWSRNQSNGPEMADEGSHRGTRTLKPSPRRTSPHQVYHQEKYAPPPRPQRTEDHGRKWCGLRRRDENPKRKRRRFCCLACVIIFLIIVIILSAVLATQLGHGDDGGDGGNDTDSGDGPSQWLNLTDFPPMPTGFSTIARPNAAVQNSKCIQPATMWSCALPKEVQGNIKPNEANQPNFQFDVIFDNATYDSLSTSGGNVESALGTSAVGRMLKRFLGLRDSSFENAFKPSPPTPGIEDQKFIGKTTDDNSKPFQGELTPFYISFFDIHEAPSRVRAKRAESSTSTSSGPFPTLSNFIPPPDELPDGTAAAANLLPVPKNQPIRLYDRGLPTEHYGFYTYFDRSIFLKSDSVVSGSGPLGPIPADRNGGSSFDSASVRCTWRQTRFLVQIWTNAADSLELLEAPSDTSSATLPASTGSRDSPSATYFTRPGSFPYPVSIVLDRHGGDADVKSVYCYGMDRRGRIVESEAKFQFENRTVGGELVNPSEGPFGNVTGTIDGGTGGCKCEWDNWRRKL